MLARVCRLISTSAALIFIAASSSSSSVLAGSSGSSSSSSSSLSGAPTFDSTVVPQLVQDYSASSYGSSIQLPQTSSWIQFTAVAPALTESYAWLTTDNVLSSYAIVSGNNINAGGSSSIAVQSSKPPAHTTVTSCENPVISSTLDSENDGYQYAYLRCGSATIIRASINDDTGDMIVDYANPITVTSNVTLKSDTYPYSSYTPKLMSPMFVVPRANASDLLLVTGNGALFVIDSQTGKQYCNQFGPNSADIGISPGTIDEIQFTVTAADSSSPRIFALARDSFNHYNMINMNLPKAGGEWQVSLTLGQGPSSTYAMSMSLRETPYSVFYIYKYSYNNQWKIQKQSKSKFGQLGILQTVTTFTPLSATSIYESDEYAQVALLLSSTYWYRVDFTSASTHAVSQIYSSIYSTPLLDQAKGRAYFMTSGDLAVIDLSTFVSSYGYSNTYLSPSYRFAYMQAQPGQPYSRFPKIFTPKNGNAYSYYNILPIIGQPGSNSFVVFSPLYSSSSGYLKYSVGAQVITTTSAASCGSLPYSTSISQTCGCGSLTGTKTARTCAWNGYSCSASLMAYTTPYCYTPYVPPTKKANLGLILGLTIPLSVFFIILIVAICIMRKRRNATRASAISGVAPGGVVISSVPFLSPSAPSSSSSAAVIGIPLSQGMVHHPAGSMIPMAMIVTQPAYSQPYHQLPSQQQQQSMYPQV